MTTQRRRFLRLCGAVGVGTLAGCSTTSTDTPTGNEGTATAEQPPDPTPQWNRTYGTGDGNHALFAAVDGVDGGHFFAGGSTSATGGDSFDEWVLKLDSAGEQAWERVPTDDEGTNVLTTATAVSDGYVVGGFSTDEGTVYDARMRKFGADGTDEWDRTFERRQGWTVLPGIDDGYLLAGTTIERNPDAWIQTVDSDGNERWSATVDDGDREVVFGGEAVGDGYVFAGYSSADSGPRGYLLDVDTDGSKRWSELVTGEEQAELKDVVAVEGGYIAAGVTYVGVENDGTAADDGLVVKVDEGGSVQWSRTVAERDGGRFESIVASDGSLYAVGEYGTGDARDGWVVELDSSGEELASTTYGTDSYDTLDDVTRTADGAYLLSGETARSAPGQSEGWGIKVTDPVAGVPDE